MVNKCPNCGNEVKIDDKFCLSCGTKINSRTLNQTPPRSIEQQTYTQTQEYQPMLIPPRKSKMKLITAIISVIVIVAVIAIILLVVFGGGGHSDSRFYGTWTIDYMVTDGEYSYPTSTITFSSDGKLVTDTDTSTNTGTWEIKGDKLYIYTLQGSVTNNIGFNYEFSDNNNSLMIGYSGYVNGEYHSLEMVFIKA